MPIEIGEGRKVSINVINFLMSVVAYCSYLQMFDEIKRAMSEHSNKTAAISPPLYPSAVLLIGMPIRFSVCIIVEAE